MSTSARYHCLTPLVGLTIDTTVLVVVMVVAGGVVVMEVRCSLTSPSACVEVDDHRMF